MKSYLLNYNLTLRLDEVLLHDNLVNKLAGVRKK